MLIIYLLIHPCTVFLTMVHHLFEYSHTIRRKIPLLTLCLQLAVANIFYRGCDTEIFSGYYVTGFWIYFPVMCTLCLLWEIFDAINTYQKIYNHKSKRSIRWYGVASGSVSLWTYVSVSYFMGNGRSYDCVFTYDNLTANILFYTTILLVLCFSYIEYYKWGSDGPLLGNYHGYGSGSGYVSISESDDYYSSFVNWGTTNRSIGANSVC